MKPKKFFARNGSFKKEEAISWKDMLKCLIESIIYTFIILAVFYFLPYMRKNFLELNLHPLAVMVAFMSLSYGIYLGFISASVATAGYLYVYMASGNDMVLFLFEFQYYKFFLMFFFIAMLMGKFQSNYRTREEELRREKLYLENMLKLEKSKNEEMLDINISLKNQIIMSKGSIVSFHKIFGKLSEAKTAEEVYEKLPLALCQFMNCEETGILKLENGYLKKIVKNKEEEMKIIKWNSFEAKRYVKVFEMREIMEFSMDLDGSSPMFVAPLFYKNEIKAFLEITRLSYNASKSYDFEIFKIVEKEVNKILKNLED